MSKKLYLFIFVVFLFQSLVACANNPESKYKTYHNIETEVSFRAWEQKGLGEVIEKNKISVLMPNDRHNDIIILYWSEGMSHYRAEVYRAEVTDDEVPTTWSLVSPDKGKTLTDQHGQFFLILELISGTGGGQRMEQFRLQR